MPVIRLVLLILAFVMFVLAACEIKLPKTDLVAIGLALLAASMILGTS